MATLFYFSLLNINNTDGLFIPRIINTFAALIKKAMKFDIKKHIYYSRNEQAIGIIYV